MIPAYQDFGALYSIFASRGLSYPVHLHDHMELCYVEEGRTLVTVGSHQRMLERGEMAIAFPHRLHSYTAQPGMNRCILAICPAATCPDYTETLRTHHPVDPFLTAESLHGDVHRSFRALVKAVEENEPVDVVKAYVHLILARTLPKLELIVNRAKSQDEALRVIEYVGEHFAEPLSLNSLGEALDMSPFRISRIFSDKLSTSFPGYLNALRIQQAQMLLQSTSQDILAIAYACGYETPRTFNREFRRMCGCTPREYRKMRTPTVQNTGVVPAARQNDA